MRYILRLEDKTRCEYFKDVVDTVPVLANTFNVDKIIIFVQDTVLANIPPHCVEVEQESMYTKYVEQEVRNMYMRFIEKYIDIDLSKIELIVCPGIGEYKNRSSGREVYLSIAGELYDLYAVLLHKSCKDTVFN